MLRNNNQNAKDEALILTAIDIWFPFTTNDKLLGAELVTFFVLFSNIVATML